LRERTIKLAEVDGDVKPYYASSSTNISTNITTTTYRTHTCRTIYQGRSTSSDSETSQPRPRPQKHIKPTEPQPLEAHPTHIQLTPPITSPTITTRGTTEKTSPRSPYSSS
jgi:hypothetical protein